MTDDLEALFDEIASQREEAPAADTAPDLDALFDEVAAQREETPAADPTPDIAPPSQPAPVVANADASVEESTEDATGKPLYERLGSIVRQLHTSLRELGYDRALQDVASEVTDAKGRLEYVAALTEQAATRVLNSIDIGLPQQDLLIKDAKDLDSRWSQLFDGNLSIDEFKVLAKDSQNFAVTTVDAAEQEKARLMEIMMAQDFQDITGQIIKKVVFITQKLEQELAQLLRDNAPAVAKEKEVDLLAGPDLPTRAMVQDDVDSLLANLGF